MPLDLFWGGVFVGLVLIALTTAQNDVVQDTTVSPSGEDVISGNCHLVVRSLLGGHERPAVSTPALLYQEKRGPTGDDLSKRGGRLLPFDGFQPYYNSLVLLVLFV